MEAGNSVTGEILFLIFTTMSSTVLVTGAAGFIGSHVAEELVKLNYRVIGIDDLSGGFESNIVPGVEFIKGSVTDPVFLNSLFAEYKFEYVFHLAAYAAEGLSHFIRNFNYNNNLIGSMNVINASINAGTVKCFVFTSSIAVYGKNQLPIVEWAVPMPEDPYGISKYATELDLKAAHDMFGLPYIIFRPHNVYGERQNLGDPYRNVVGIFMNQIMQGKELTIFGDGSQTRAFSYISDVAPIIASAIEKPEAYNEVFNIGADKPFTVLELAQSIGRAMMTEVKIKFLEARNEVQHAYAAHDKVRTYFGGLIKDVDLEDGIERMVEWAKSAGPQIGKKFKGIEIEKNLPPSWKNLTE